MSAFRLGDSVRHRLDAGALGQIVEVRTTFDRGFRLLRVRWLRGPSRVLTWEMEENLTTTD